MSSWKRRRAVWLPAALQAIERRVTHMITVFAPEGKGSLALGAGAQARAGLLNGPQLPEVGMHQADVDALLASFD